MEIDAFLKNLQTAIQAQTELPVYLSYDAAAFSDREAAFFVLSLAELKVETPFQTADGVCYGCAAVVSVTLLMPPETDSAEMFAALHQAVLTDFLGGSYAVQTVQIGEPTPVRQLARQSMTAKLTLNGICLPETEAEET